MKRAIPLILISLFCADAYAQTIADIARRERERRAASGNSVPVTRQPATAQPPAVGAAAIDKEPAAAATRVPLITLTATRSTTAADIGGQKDDVFRFYDVRGTTSAELVADIARRSPVSDGAQHQGVTNWRFSWQPMTSSSSGKCVMTSMNVLLTIEIVIPRWTNEVGAPSSLSESWRTYLTGLLRHEHGHKDIALAGAEEVRQLVKTGAPQGTCAAAVAAANAAGKIIFDKTVARQRQYDKDTDHGRAQGVRLP